MSEIEPKKRFKAGVLGATGTVGQRFMQLCESHPWIEVSTLGASASSAGQTYKETARWKLTSPLPECHKESVIVLCEPEYFKGCDMIFSALDSSVAGPIEEAFASAGFPVFSNARNHRYDDDVPILVPHANADHIDIIKAQREKRGYKSGFIVTNANCSSTGLVIALAPLHEAFTIKKLMVFTMQAISGAGYPGVASLDIMDNVVPYISGEEGKVETEPLKMLGKLVDGSSFEHANFKVSAHCNRVNVIDGHTECISIEFEKKPSVEEVEAVLRSFTSEAQVRKLPSAPPAPIIVQEDDSRPQPRLDRDAGNGYAVTVGRVRTCPLFDVRLTLCSHNTIIGAAGGSILNAELAISKGYIV